MSLKNELIQIKDLEYSEGVDLTSYTTFRLRSIGDLLVVKSILALQNALEILNKHNREYLVIGWGANQILPPVCDKIIMNLDFEFDKNYFSEKRDEYNLPASLGLNHLTAHAVKFGLKGWEVFTGIPASLGGAIFMNAGTNLGEIGALVKSVEVMNSKGVIREEFINEKSFGYRKNHFVKSGEIIISAKLRHLGVDDSISQKIKDYMEYRRSTQPLSSKNCGCVFKNPLPGFQAGRLIDSLGLKDLRVGNLKISSKHANFMENLGEATWEDFSILVKTIQDHMDKFYGLKFELEVKIPYDL